MREREREGERERESEREGGREREREIRLLEWKTKRENEVVCAHSKPYAKFEQSDKNLLKYATLNFCDLKM